MFANLEYYFTEDGIFQLLESVFHSGEGTGLRFMVYLILILVVGGYFMRGVFDYDSSTSLSVLIFSVSLSIMLYNRSESEFTWFCKEPRWWWMVINFLLYAAVCYGHGALLAQQTYLTSHRCHYIGLFSVPVCLVALYAAVYFYNKAVPWVIWAFILCQAIQAIIILVRATHYENLFKAILHTAAYIMGMMAALILGYHLLIMLIFVAIGAVALKFVEGFGSSEVTGSSGRVHGFVYEMGGTKFVRLENGQEHEIWSESDTGFMTDSNGMSWYSNGGLGDVYSFDTDKV